MSAPMVRVGQTWSDGYGDARVLAIAEGYVMLRRRRCNPFLVSVDVLVMKWEQVK